MARVFIVDDEPDICIVMAEFLSVHGYRVKTFGEGLGALAAITSDPPDLVMTNLNMPGLRGLDMIRRLLQDGIETRIVIMTGYSTADTWVASIDLGVCEYIIKPFQLKRVLDALKRHVPDPEATNLGLMRQGVSARLALALSWATKGNRSVGAQDLLSLGRKHVRDSEEGTELAGRAYALLALAALLGEGETRESALAACDAVRNRLGVGDLQASLRLAGEVLEALPELHADSGRRITN